MRKQNVAWIFSFLFLLTSCVRDTGDLRQNIQEEFSKVEGTFALAFRDPNSGTELLINEKMSFHAASTMKTAVMMEVFQQALEGKFKLSDSIMVKNEFKSIVDGSPYSLNPEDDSEGELYHQIGQKKTIRDLVTAMIVSSSNLATNIVIDLVDAENVTKTLRTLGVNDMKVLRGVEDTKAFEKGLNNTTTAYDLLILFQKLANEELVSHDDSHAMIDILVGQHFNEMIPAKLPKDVLVAHKTGNITGVQHDGGIVMLPDGRRYVIVFLSKDLKDINAAQAAMANVSEMIYKFVMGS